MAQVGNYAHMRGAGLCAMVAVTGVLTRTRSLLPRPCTEWLPLPHLHATEHAPHSSCSPSRAPWAEWTVVRCRFSPIAPRTLFVAHPLCRHNASSNQLPSSSAATAIHTRKQLCSISFCSTAREQTSSLGPNRDPSAHEGLRNKVRPRGCSATASRPF